MGSSELVGEQTEAFEAPAKQPAATSASARSAAPKHPLLDLQRRAGNRSVVEYLGAQAALEVGRADDPLEHEAESVADRVVAQLRRSGRAQRTATKGVAAGGLAQLIRAASGNSARGRRS